MTNTEREVYYWLRHCSEYPCLFGKECPYAKYGDDGVKCKRRLMNHAADIIKNISRLREDCI
jgi:hypothetical protein